MRRERSTILQRWSVRWIAVSAVFLLITSAYVSWYHAPASVESLDSMIYCRCGYSTVRFHDGRITMVEYPHDTVKPGEQIGTYHVRGNLVDLDISFNGESQKETLAIDNIGILAPKSVSDLCRYYAINFNAPKTQIHFGLERVGSWIRF